MGTDRPLPLIRVLQSARGDLGRARRMLPKPGPGQSAEQARAAYWIERAVWCLLQAEAAWEPYEPDRRGWGTR